MFSYNLWVVYNDGSKEVYNVRAPNLFLAFEYLRDELTHKKINYDIIVFE